MPTARPSPSEPLEPQAPQTRAVRAARVFGTVMFLAVTLGLVSLPWPFPVLTALACGAAVVLGIVALVRLRGARVKGALVPVVAAGLALAVVLSTASLTQLVLWREYREYSSCLGSALTEQARDGCRARLEDMLRDRMPAVGQLVPPDDAAG